MHNHAFDQLISAAGAEYDRINTPKIYIDLAGELAAGIALGQIYDVLTSEDSLVTATQRVERDGHIWLVRRREDWFEAARLKPRQVDRALRVLQERNLIKTKVARYLYDPVLHVRIIWPEFLEALQALLDSYAESHGIHRA